MVTFRKVRQLLLLRFDDVDISEDEFLLLYDANNSKNPDFPYQNYEHFDLEELDESECLAEFRFRKRDIPLLAEAMRLPTCYICKQGTVFAFSGLEIATHWSPMRLKIENWRLNFQSWSPACDSRFVRSLKKATTQLLC